MKESRKGAVRAARLKLTLQAHPSIGKDYLGGQTAIRGRRPMQQLFAGPPQDAAAYSATGCKRNVPFRGPRLRALITLIRSSNSCAEQFFLASNASAA